MAEVLIAGVSFAFSVFTLVLVEQRRRASSLERRLEALDRTFCKYAAWETREVPPAKPLPPFDKGDL